MSTKHEEFIFFQECITSLNSAWCIIKALNAARETDKTLAWAACRMALIEYAKPYKKSIGIQIKQHVLPLPTLSVEDIALHEQIIHLRDTVLAHSDLCEKNAKLYIGNIAGKPFPIIASNTSPSLPPMSVVRGLIERSLDELYKQLPDWEAEFNAAP